MRIYCASIPENERHPLEIKTQFLWRGTLL